MRTSSDSDSEPDGVRVVSSLQDRVLNGLQMSSRKFRYSTCQPFRDESFESGVIVAPSNISGLGLFSLRRFEKGECICLYSGQCKKGVMGNNSPYLLEFNKWDSDAKQYRK